jgi:hypothetical protein
VKPLRGKLTYANVTSTLCLFLLLGGGAALASSKLGRNSVGTRQLRRSAVTTAKIKNRAITRAKIDPASLDPVPSATIATNAADANALGGRPASAYATATAVRSVTLTAQGTVVPSQSDGVDQGNVSHSEKGVYCIDGLTPPPTTAVGSLNFLGEFETEMIVQVSPVSPAAICTGSELGVFLTLPGTGPVNEPFSLIIH